mgnify:CR=1 FL=1
MIGTHDPEGVEKRTLHDLVDFNGKGVFEVGCGEGRMTWLYADAAASVLGLDPDEDAISEAREQTARHLGNKVEFRVAGMMGVKLDENAYDIGVLAWSI